MFYKKSQSILDQFINYFPQYRDYISPNKNYIDSSVANSLFQIWRTSENKINDKLYKKPATLAHDQLEKMKKNELIKVIGDKIEITEKGAEVIKIMILGDDRSSFEDKNGVAVDYTQALSNTKNVNKVAKKLKVADNWWDRF